MKGSSDTLLKLIGHLTEVECKLFVETVRANYSQHEPLYLQFFHLILAKQPKSARELKELSEGTDLEKNFTFTKYYLRKQLEEFLSQEDNKDSQIAAIHKHISLAHTYFKRGMTKVADNHVEKAKKLATRNSLYGYLYEINHLTRKFRIGLAFIPPSKGTFEDTYETDRGIVKSMSNMIQLRELQYETDALNNEKNELSETEFSESISSILNNPLISNRKSLPSFAEKRKACDVMANIYNMLGDFEKVIESRKEFIEILLSDDRQATNDYLYTLTMSYNYAAALFDVGDVEGMKELSKRLTALLSAKENDSSAYVNQCNAKFILTNINLITSWLEKDDIAFEKAVKEGKDFLQNDIPNLVPGFHHFFLDNIAQKLFLEGRTIEALPYFDSIYNEPETKPTLELDIDTRLRRLLCLLDAEETNRLISNCQSTQKFLKRKKRLSPFLNLMINSVQKMAMEDNRNRLPQYKELLQATNEHLKSPKAQIVLFNTDLKEWLERK